MGRYSEVVKLLLALYSFSSSLQWPRNGVQGNRKNNSMTNIIGSSSLKKDYAKEDCWVICLSVCHRRKHRTSICKTPAVLCFKKAALRPEELSHSALRWRVFSAVRPQWNTCWLQGVRKAQSQWVHLFVHLSPLQRFPSWQGALLRLISPASPLTSSLIMLIRLSRVLPDTGESETSMPVQPCPAVYPINVWACTAQAHECVLCGYEARGFPGVLLYVLSRITQLWVACWDGSKGAKH